MYFFAEAVAYCSLCFLPYVRCCLEPTKGEQAFQQRAGVRLPPVVGLIALQFTVGLVALLFTVGLVALLLTVGLVTLLFTVWLVALP